MKCLPVTAEQFAGFFFFTFGHIFDYSGTESLKRNWRSFLFPSIKEILHLPVFLALQPVPFYNDDEMGNFEPLGHLIQDFSKDHVLGQKLLEVRLQQEWPSIVGQTLAKHSSPDSIRFHKLYLVADNSVWLQQLVFLKPTILQTLQTRIPELSLVDIVLRLGPLSTPKTQPEEISPNIPEPSPAHVAFAHQMADRLSNPELREALRHTIAKGLSQPGKE